MIKNTTWQIEGLNPEGLWVMIDRPVDPLCDQRAQRDECVRVLRERQIKRYSKVRLVKHVTSIEVIGEDITV